VEPEPKDTGPCIALAAHYFLREQFDGVLVTAPSDQYIPDADALMYALRTAEKAAQTDGVVVTLGIVPTRPETGYGYIQAEPVDEVSSNGLLPVASFIEKPTLDKAEVLIRQPNIYWNSGIFVWKPSTIARYMEKYCPDIWLGVTVSEARLPDEYAKLNKISIDYAIVEKAETLFTIPVSFPWDDVGTWKSLERVFSKDEQGNILLGDIIASDNRNSIIYSESRRVVVIGAEDLIIVSTDEGVLVCHKSAEQQIKQAIQLLYKNKGCEKP
jgi:mannose-1-phosphate guanylyltransferase